MQINKHPEQISKESRRGNIFISFMPRSSPPVVADLADCIVTLFCVSVVFNLVPRLPRPIRPQEKEAFNCFF